MNATTTSAPAAKPLARDAAIEKYAKAAALRYTSPASEWLVVFPDAASLATFRAEVGDCAWPEQYGQSPWDDAFSLACTLADCAGAWQIKLHGKDLASDTPHVRKTAEGFFSLLASYGLTIAPASQENPEQEQQAGEEDTAPCYGSDATRIYRFQNEGQRARWIATAPDSRHACDAPADTTGFKELRFTGTLGPVDYREGVDTLTPALSALASPVATLRDAVAFLAALAENGKTFHPDESAEDLVHVADGKHLFKPEESPLADERMNECRALAWPEFIGDVCGACMLLSPEGNSTAEDLAAFAAWREAGCPAVPLPMSDERRLVTAKNKWGHSIPVYDDGSGPVFIHRDSMGISGIVRAQTREDAYGICKDEFFPEASETLEEMEAEYGENWSEDACWNEAFGFRPNGPRSVAEDGSERDPIGHGIYSKDLNGDALDKLTPALLAELEITLETAAW